MEDWEPVRRTDQAVMGTDDLGNVIVEVILSPTPPTGWESLWTPYPPNSSRSTAYGPPHVHGNKVTFHVPENKVKSAVEMLDGQIAAANDFYEEETLPRLQAAQDQRHREEEERQRKLDAAQRQLDELDD